MMIGFDRTQWNGLPLPVSLAALGAPGCSVDVGIIATANVSTGSGSTTMTLRVPHDLRLLGEEILFQLAVFDIGANALGLVTTNGLAAEVRW